MDRIGAVGMINGVLDGVPIMDMDWIKWIGCMKIG